MLAQWLKASCCGEKPIATSALGQSRHFDSAPRTSALPRSADIADQVRQVRKVPTPDILGATVVASGRGASRVVAAYLPPTEPRGRSVTLTCFIRWPAGVKLPTPGPVFSLRL